MRDVDEKYHAVYLEEASIQRKLEKVQKETRVNSTRPHSTSFKYCDINSIPKNIGSIADMWLRNRTNGITSSRYYNTIEIDELYERLREVKSERKELEKLRSSTSIQRNLYYPLAMLLLLALTGITILIVVQNALELLIGIKALPLSTRVKIQTVNSTRIIKQQKHMCYEQIF